MILVLNAGSSTVKFACFDQDTFEPKGSGLVGWKGKGPAELIFNEPGKPEFKGTGQVKNAAEAVQAAVDMLAAHGVGVKGPGVSAVGHRVVHGGSAFRSSVVIDEAVTQELARLSDLAPLHNPPALEALGAARAALPNVPHVAVFDTSFFQALEPFRYVYPLPYKWYEEWGVRRYGFHGTSHRYCGERAAEMLGAEGKKANVVVCHLGNGCSASAQMHGQPVATTMGFTPLEGLMMGTRSGSIDLGILAYARKKGGFSIEELDRIFNRESGLLGVSGVSSDYRLVDEAARAGNERARLALDMYADRIRSAIGSLAVALGHLEALVFTAGVGEHSASLRHTVANGLGVLGITIDEEKNRTCEPDADISAPGSRTKVLVIHTQEEKLIARETVRVTNLQGVPAAH